jgi:hypothetical protein
MFSNCLLLRCSSQNFQGTTSGRGPAEFASPFDLLAGEFRTKCGVAKNLAYRFGKSFDRRFLNRHRMSVGDFAQSRAIHRNHRGPASHRFGKRQRKSFG